MFRPASALVFLLGSAFGSLSAQEAAPVLLEMRPMPDRMDQDQAKAACVAMRMWLDRDHHREQVLQSPQVLHRWRDETGFAGPDGARLCWYPHELRPRDAEQWQYSFTMGELKAITLPLFDPKVLQQAPPDPDARLVELVLVDVSGRHFTGADLAKVDVVAGADGTPSLQYEVRAEQKAHYADWSESLIRRHSAIVLDGMLVSAPTFMSRIPGIGAIHGSFKPTEVERLGAGLKVAIDHPWASAPRAGAPLADPADPLVAIAHLVQLRTAKDDKLRRASAIALRAYVDHPQWLAERLVASLAAEQEVGVLVELAATVGMLEGGAKSALARLRELEQHADQGVAQVANRARLRVEAAVAGKR